MSVHATLRTKADFCIVLLYSISADPHVPSDPSVLVSVSILDIVCDVYMYPYLTNPSAI